MTRTRVAPMITVDPKIMNGRPTVEGTRITVELIMDDIAAGEPPAEVAHAYRLSSEQVQAAIDYARELVARSARSKPAHVGT